MGCRLTTPQIGIGRGYIAALLLLGCVGVAAAAHGAEQYHEVTIAPTAEVPVTTSVIASVDEPLPLVAPSLRDDERALLHMEDIARRYPTAEAMLNSTDWDAYLDAALALYRPRRQEPSFFARQVTVHNSEPLLPSQVPEPPDLRADAGARKSLRNALLHAVAALPPVDQQRLWRPRPADRLVHIHTVQSDVHFTLAQRYFHTEIAAEIQGFLNGTHNEANQLRHGLDEVRYVAIAPQHHRRPEILRLPQQHDGDGALDVSRIVVNAFQAHFLHSASARLNIPVMITNSPLVAIRNGISAAPGAVLVHEEVPSPLDHNIKLGTIVVYPNPSHIPAPPDSALTTLRNLVQRTGPSLQARNALADHAADLVTSLLPSVDDYTFVRGTEAENSARYLQGNADDLAFESLDHATRYVAWNEAWQTLENLAAQGNATARNALESFAEDGLAALGRSMPAAGSAHSTDFIATRATAALGRARTATSAHTAPPCKGSSAGRYRSVLRALMR